MWWLASGAAAGAAAYLLLGDAQADRGRVRALLARVVAVPALRRAREREASARVVAACERQVPEMLDILALGLSAGLSFDASLALYCERSEVELARQLLRAMRGWQMGLEGRREALEVWLPVSAPPRSRAFAPRCARRSRLGRRSRRRSSGRRMPSGRSSERACSSASRRCR